MNECAVSCEREAMRRRVDALKVWVCSFVCFLVSMIELDFGHEKA